MRNGVAAGNLPWRAMRAVCSTNGISPRRRPLSVTRSRRWCCLEVKPFHQKRDIFFSRAKSGKVARKPYEFEPFFRLFEKTVVVTGGAQGIGKCIAECFRREGAIVHVIDKQDGPWFTGDLADKATLERFAADVIEKSGSVDVLVNNARPLFKGIDECIYEEFAYAQAVGVVAT